MADRVKPHNSERFILEAIVEFTFKDRREHDAGKRDGRTSKQAKRKSSK
jgi:hypothetical protein